MKALNRFGTAVFAVMAVLTVSALGSAVPPWWLSPLAPVQPSEMNSTNISVTLTNPGPNAATETTNVIYVGVDPATGVTQQTQRASLSFCPDSATDYYVSPAPSVAPGPGITNNMVVNGNQTNYPLAAGTAGYLVTHGSPAPTNTYTTAWPLVWATPFNIYISKSAMSSGTALTVTIPVKDIFAP
jgi:hypothetical protein